MKPIDQMTFEAEKGLHYEALLPQMRSLLEQAADAGFWCLDLGTGGGRVAFELAPHVRWVLGLDVLRHRIERARVRAQNDGIGNVQFIVGDVENISYEDLAPVGTFQLITANLCVTDSIISRVSPALERGGRFIGTCFEQRHWQETGASSPFHYSEAALRAKLESSGLKVNALGIHTRKIEFGSLEDLIEKYLPKDLVSYWEESSRLSFLKESYLSGNRILTESKIVFDAERA